MENLIFCAGSVFFFDVIMILSLLINFKPVGFFHAIKNIRFSDIFRVYKKETSDMKWFN